MSCISHHNCYDFVELRHNVTGEHIVVEEFDDYSFDMGYRFVRYVPNSQVNYPEVYASQQDLAMEVLLGSSSDPMIEVDAPYDSSDPIYVQEPEIY